MEIKATNYLHSGKIKYAVLQSLGKLLVVEKERCSMLRLIIKIFNDNCEDLKGKCCKN